MRIPGYLFLSALILSGCSCQHSDNVQNTKSTSPFIIHQPHDTKIKSSPESLSSGQSFHLTRKGSKRHKKEGFQLSEKNQKLPSPARQFDSSFISKVAWLKSLRIDLDLNEPVNRAFLSSELPTKRFPSMIQLSRESFLKLSFDNDILDYTDRFYTNGLRFDLISPALQLNPIGKIMLPYWGTATNYYGITICQNMYTPSTTKVGGILIGDRPYAAYLYLGSFRISNDTIRQVRQTSEIWIGIIGPSSFGEWVQRSFHNSVPTNNEPLGWEYQIRNDLLLNYNLMLEKGVFNRRNIDLVLIGYGFLGTLYTNLSGGLQLRAGWLNPYFANLGVSGSKRLRDAGLRKSQIFFFLRGAGKLVGYDATLQGGLLNRSSVYTLPGSEISRFVFNSSAGISVSYGGIRLDVEQYLLSPEFHDGWWHKWVHLGLTFSL